MKALLPESVQENGKINQVNYILISEFRDVIPEGVVL